MHFSRKFVLIIDRSWENDTENEISRVNKETENIKNKQDIINIEL
jgi:hypothetical protein